MHDDLKLQPIREYEAFNFALTLDQDAAYQSISMGFGQIMGFNYNKNRGALLLLYKKH